MLQEIQKALLPITESTGLEIDLYSSSGDLIFATSEERDYTYVLHKATDFVDNILQDKLNGVTYFAIEVSRTSLVGVIMGSTEVSRNYAIMVSKIVENIIANHNESITTSEKIKLLLSGQLSQNQTNSLKSLFLSRPFNYYVLTVILENPKKRADMKSFLDAICDRADIVVETSDNIIAFLKSGDVDDSDYQSASEFAFTLYENISEESTVKFCIGVGGVAKSFDDLTKMYDHSLYAYTLGKLVDPKNHIYSYKEYIMLNLLSVIPHNLLSEYLGDLLDKNSLELIADEELMNTADSFLKNSLNISETSREMYLHRNTLIYRLDKIEKATGLNIRHFTDALTFRLIVILSKLIENKKT